MGIPTKNLFFLDYPDGKISYNHQETDKLSRLIKNIHPHAIFIPHKGEGWNDHIQAGNIIRRITKEMTDIRLYEYCVWFWYYNTWKIDWKNAQLLNMTKEEQLSINIYILRLPAGNRGPADYPTCLLKPTIGTKNYISNRNKYETTVV